MSEIALSIPRGTARNFTFQALNFVDGTIPEGVFSGSPPLTTQVFRANDVGTPVCTPTTVWKDPTNAIFTVAFKPADTMTLELAVYILTTNVFWGTIPSEIFRTTICVETTAAPSTLFLPDLVTVPRCVSYIPNMSDEEFEKIPELITDASAACRNITRQRWTVATYDELYSTRESGRITLRQVPVRSLNQLLSDPWPILKIYANNLAYQQAWAGLASTGGPWVGYSSTGLNLSYVSYGVTTTIPTITWSSCPTLRDVAAAVSALGNGWTVSLDDGYSGYSPTVLHAPQGPFPCCSSSTGFGPGNTAQFIYHTRPVGPTAYDPENGIIEVSLPWSTDVSLLFPYATEIIDRSMPYSVGVYAYRAIYQAGYATITAGFPNDELPGDLAAAVVLTVQRNLEARKTNPLYASRSLNDFSYSLSKHADVFVPEAAQRVFMRYCDYHSALSL
jgi:hypothetical protein